MSIAAAVIIFVLGAITGATVIMVFAAVEAERAIFGDQKEPTREEWHDNRQ